MLKSRTDQLRDEVHGTELEKVSAENQVDYINKELTGLRELEQAEAHPSDPTIRHGKERERIQGNIGRDIAEMAKSNGQIGEYNLQIMQLKEKFQEQVAGSFDRRSSETRRHPGENSRNEVTFSVESKSLRLLREQPRTSRVFTIGQVLRAGEPLLDIIPKNEFI